MTVLNNIVTSQAEILVTLNQTLEVQKKKNIFPVKSLRDFKILNDDIIGDEDKYPKKTQTP